MHKELTLRGEFKSSLIFFVIGKVTDLDDTPDIKILWMYF